MLLELLNHHLCVDVAIWYSKVNCGWSVTYSDCDNEINLHFLWQNEYCKEICSVGGPIAWGFLKWQKEIIFSIFFHLNASYDPIDRSKSETVTRFTDHTIITKTFFILWWLHKRIILKSLCVNSLCITSSRQRTVCRNFFFSFFCCC